jgi:hypothetical protein
VVASRRGRGFDLTPTSLRSLEPFRDHLTIVSNTDVDPAEPFTAQEIGGDHFRSSAVFLTQAHPKQTRGGDVRAGVSLDQCMRSAFGQDTLIPSMQLCIEPWISRRVRLRLLVRVHRRDQLGVANAPAADDPRSACGVRSAVRAFTTARSPEERRARNGEDRSILDRVLSVRRAAHQLGPGDRRASPTISTT